MSSKKRRLFGRAVPTLVAVVALILGGTVDSPVAASSQDGDMAEVLDRIGSYARRYFVRAQTLVCHEHVRMQPFGRDLIGNGRARRLEHELRVEWAPGPLGAPAEATVVRQLLTVNGRAPDPKDEPGCMDPRSVSPEPLAMFLPEQQSDYVFTPDGTGRAAGRRALKVKYKATTQGPPEIAWKEGCVSVDLPGRSKGRVWVDEASGEVLRIDEHLGGLFEIPVPRDQQRRGSPRAMVIERVDTSIRYERVTFHDPEEILLMPASIVTVTVVRDAGVPRMRTTQTFSNYRRFVTDVRLLD